MIRDRRDEDLDRLCEILQAFDGRAGAWALRQPRAWLTEVVAERSWVFDQAPIPVAPTRNVVGHVQIYRPTHAPWVDVVAGRAVRGELLCIGRLFVRPSKHDYGIARYLLTQAVQHVEQHGSVAVLDPFEPGVVPAGLLAALGFAETPTGRDERSVWVRTRRS